MALVLCCLSPSVLDYFSYTSGKGGIYEVTPFFPIFLLKVHLILHSHSSPESIWKTQILGRDSLQP